MTAKLDLNTLSHVREQLSIDLKDQMRRSELHLGEFSHDPRWKGLDSWQRKRDTIEGQIREIESMMRYLTNLIRDNQ